MPGSKFRRRNYRISYESRPLPLKKTKNKTLIAPDNDAITLRFDKRFITNASEVSLQEVSVKPLAGFKTKGEKRCCLYCQPMCSHQLKVPEKKTNSVLKAEAKVLAQSKAETQQIDASSGKELVGEINRMFHNSVHWTQNDAWLLEVCDRIAREIIRLSRMLEEN